MICAVKTIIRAASQYIKRIEGLQYVRLLPSSKFMKIMGLNDNIWEAVIKKFWI